MLRCLLSPLCLLSLFSLPLRGQEPQHWTERRNLGFQGPVRSALTTVERPNSDPRPKAQRKLMTQANPDWAVFDRQGRRVEFASVQQDVRMLATLDDIGHALTSEEEAAAVLSACLQSRSRSLYPAVMLALNTGMRYGEIRLLLWKQLDFTGKMLTVGKSKTRAGTGRVIPLNARILNVLEMWAAQFPDREPTHYLFPFEKCGARGEEDTFGFTAGVIFYGTEPTRPIGDWKEAWEKARSARRPFSKATRWRPEKPSRRWNTSLPRSEA